MGREAGEEVTRKEQTEKAALKHRRKFKLFNPEQDFIMGAEWADANPIPNRYSEFEQVINNTAMIQLERLTKENEIMLNKIESLDKEADLLFNAILFAEEFIKRLNTQCSDPDVTVLGRDYYGPKVSEALEQVRKMREGRDHS